METPLLHAGGRHRLRLRSVLALGAIVAALAGCTGIADPDPSAPRGPSGAAVIDESQAAALANGGEAMVEALRRGGFVLVFQHAATDRKGERKVDLTNCSTQRNLSATGRQQATQLGSAVERLRIPIADVVTSPYCRTRDTAWLAFDRAEAGPDLTLVRSEEDRPGAAGLARRLATPPPPGSNTVLVTHAETIEAALGLTLEPGEVLAYQARFSGEPLLARRFSVATLLVLARDVTGGDVEQTRT